MRSPACRPKKEQELAQKAKPSLGDAQVPGNIIQNAADVFNAAPHALNRLEGRKEEPDPHAFAGLDLLENGRTPTPSARYCRLLLGRLLSHNALKRVKEMAVAETEIENFLDELVQKGIEEGIEKGIEIGDVRGDILLEMSRFGDSFARAHRSQLRKLYNLAGLRQILQLFDKEGVTPEEIEAQLRSALLEQAKSVGPAQMNGQHPPDGEGEAEKQP